MSGIDVNVDSKIKGTHNEMQSMKDYQGGIDSFISKYIKR
ncbi:unnamed protein product [marine sediment metagenome]|uniref:Uncharacterized protein n=1 Tax=marine sediment metagenome TaxID=412755 RepID=X0ZP90_9ZZZZ